MTFTEPNQIDLPPNVDWTVVKGTTFASGTNVLLGTLNSDVTVDPGATLQIGGGGAIIADSAPGIGNYTDNGLTGNVTGNIVDNGTVTFDHLDDYVVAGAFSGDGTLIKDGPGNLTFDGLYSFTGVTTVNGGAINIADLAGNASLDISSGTINLTGNMSTIANLTGPGQAAR